MTPVHDDQVINGTPRERIWDAIHAIEADRDHWKQWGWETPATRDECGSSYCLAGWIAIRAGYETLGRKLPGFVLARTIPKCLRDLIEPGNDGTFEEERDAVHVSGIAEALLGIGSALATHLWWGGNTLDDLKQLAHAHFGPDPRETP